MGKENCFLNKHDISLELKKVKHLRPLIMFLSISEKKQKHLNLNDRLYRPPTAKKGFNTSKA